MDIRDTRLRSINVEQTNTSEESSTSVEEQNTANLGLAAAKDSVESANLNSVFSVDITSGEVNYGDGVQGNKPPAGDTVEATYETGGGETGNTRLESLLNESQKQIFSYLKGQSIDPQKEEAGEKFDSAMQTADTSLVTGIVSGEIPIRSAFSDLQAYAEKAKIELSHTSDGVLKSNLESRYQTLSSLLKNHANEQDLQTKNLENQANHEIDYSKESRTHTDRMRDAILDFLRKLSEMSPTVLK